MTYEDMPPARVRLDDFLSSCAVCGVSAGRGGDRGDASAQDRPGMHARVLMLMLPVHPACVRLACLVCISACNVPMV